VTEAEISRSLLALLEIKGIGPGAIKKNFARIRASQTAAEVFDAMGPVTGVTDEASRATALSKAEQHISRCAEVGIVAVAIGQPKYPSPLMELGTPPAVLFCRGNLSLLASPLLGVIGTRKSNAYGEAIANRVGRHFSDNSVHLCNGLADGIDICSVTHNGMFLPGVIGVMACGLDFLEDNLTSRRTAERAGKLLEAGGLLVSEFPPGTSEDQNSVIASCRLQAGLSQVLLMVQSSSDGGSRFTAGHFAKLSRKFAFIVPPEAQFPEEAFGANLILLRGKDGLAEFVGLKTSKTIKADLLPIRSKADYGHVISLMGSASTI
jgi:DNA processing protein